MRWPEGRPIAHMAMPVTDLMAAINKFQDATRGYVIWNGFTREATEAFIRQAVAIGARPAATGERLVALLANARP